MKSLSICLAVFIFQVCGFAAETNGVVNTSTAPDKVAMGIMHKPIYPIGIHALGFAPKGDVLATGDGTGKLRLYEVGSGTLVREVAAHSNWVFAIHWTRDGSRIVTGGGDNLVQWFVAADDSYLARTIAAHSNDVHAVAVTRDGRTQYSAGDDRQVVIWDVRRAAVKKQFKAHDRQIPTLVLSPNEKLIATGSRDHTIKIWDAKNGKVRDTLLGHTADVMALSFSPDGKLLASAGWDNTVRLWEVRSGKAVRIISGEAKRVSGVAFSRDGKWVVSSGGADLRMHEVRTGNEIWAAKFTDLIRDLGGVETAEDLSAVAFSPNNELIAVGSTTGTVYFVEAGSGKVLRRLRAQENSEGHQH